MRLVQMFGKSSLTFGRGGYFFARMISMMSTANAIISVSASYIVIASPPLLIEWWVNQPPGMYPCSKIIPCAYNAMQGQINGTFQPLLAAATLGRSRKKRFLSGVFHNHMFYKISRVLAGVANSFHAAVNLCPCVNCPRIILRGV